MKLEVFSKQYNMSKNDMLYVFKDLGYFKNNNEPKTSYINKGLFSDSGDIMNVSEVNSLIKDKIDEIRRELDMKQIEELSEKVDGLYEKLDEIIELVSNNNNITEEPKKEKKHRTIDMSNRARSLIGETINGWVISGEKLNVIARKEGFDDIIVPGMKKKEEFEKLLND